MEGLGERRGDNQGREERNRRGEELFISSKEAAQVVHPVHGIVRVDFT